MCPLQAGARPSYPPAPMRLAQLLFGALALAGCGGAPPAATPRPTSPRPAAPAVLATSRLASGLDVRVVPSPGSGVVAVQLWLEASLVDEAPGERGAAQVLERLVVEGGSSAGLVRRAALAGGRARGWSEADATVFEVVAPADALSDILDAIAHAVTAPAEDDAIARIARAAAARAARAAHDAGRSDVAALLESAYGGHPLARPPHAFAPSAEGLSAPAVAAFRARRHGPGAAMLVVAGDVDPAAVRSLVEQRLGAWTGTATRRAPLPEPPAHAGPRVRVVRRPGPQARLLVGFPLPPGDAAQAAAVDVLAVLLGQGPDSRLARAAAAEGLTATDVTAYAWRPAGPGLFVAGFAVAPGDVDAAWRVLLEQVLLLADGGPGAAEVARASAAVARDARFDVETAVGRARRTAAFTFRLGEQAEAAYDEALATLHPAAVGRVAGALLAPAALDAVVALPPAGRDEPADVDRAADLSAVALEWASAGAAADDAPGVFRLGPASRLVVDALPGSGTVSIHAAALGGVAADPPDRAGTAAVVARLLARPVSGADGARVRGRVRSDAVVLEVTVPADEAETWLSHVARRLRRGDFGTDDLDRARGEVEAAQRRARSDPDRALRRALDAALHGAAHPAGREPLGRADALVTLRAEDARAWFERHVAAAPLVIAVAGDVEPSRVASVLARGLAGRPTEAPPGPAAPPARDTGAPRALAGPGPIARLAYGFPMGVLEEPAAAVVDVLAELLAGPDGPVPGTDTRVLTELRRDGGHLAWRVAGAPDALDAVRAALGAAIRGLASAPPDGAAVDRARRRLLARRLLNLERSADRARWQVSRALQGLEVGARAFAAWRAAVDAVTPADVQRLAASLRDEVVITLGPDPQPLEKR